ncbi:MAG: hypothetical protein ACRYFY_05280 [Janthinobacterium lividum]
MFDSSSRFLNSVLPYLRELLIEARNSTVERKIPRLQALPGHVSTETSFKDDPRRRDRHEMGRPVGMIGNPVADTFLSSTNFFKATFL